MRADDERYFDRIESRLDEAFDLAERAKGRGHDPETDVEIPVAKDMADRVENILGIDGVAERVREWPPRLQGPSSGTCANGSTPRRPPPSRFAPDG